MWRNCIAEGASFVRKGAPLGLIAAELIERAERHLLVEELGGLDVVETLVADGLGCRSADAYRAGTKAGSLPVPLRSAFPIDGKDHPGAGLDRAGATVTPNLSVLVAPPSSGKSLLTLQLAIAVALGMAWGGWFPRAPEKVLIINAEDDFDEMRRRLFAAAKDMDVDQARLVDRIYLAEAPESIVIAKIDHRNKAVIRTPLGEQLVATIQQAGIGVVVADPFAETFEGDENSNSEVKWAGILWREVARKTGAALWLVHHTKKYAGTMAGEQDASRGGGALIGTARIMSTLFGMTEEEASLCNIPSEERGLYVRFDDAKSNHSAKGVVKWFRKNTITLDNGVGDVAGDEVGVLAAWKPPGVMAGVAMDVITLILDKIARGVLDEDGRPTGELYGKTSNSKHWAGEVIKQMAEIDDDDRAKNIIKAWLENKVLVEAEFTNDRRKTRIGLQVVSENRPDVA